MFATRIAKTVAAAVIAVGALGVAHSFTTGEAAAPHHVSADGVGTGTTIPLNQPTGHQSHSTDVTWGH
ncbi:MULTISPECIES: hypothetical protein [Streptomyces]|uniref:Uncharacterized protein n=1 Tax=Streptomyces katrae TaxID=68223 RepID=A0A0F4J3Q4_9ACTN|nr:hypothetical protein [Streptomyces katrae]KJY28962.1 hypothetical protein VR44_24060 [Streptomyces katrae]